MKIKGVDIDHLEHYHNKTPFLNCCCSECVKIRIAKVLERRCKNASV